MQTIYSNARNILKTYNILFIKNIRTQRVLAFMMLYKNISHEARAVHYMTETLSNKQQILPACHDCCKYCMITVT